MPERKKTRQERRAEELAARKQRTRREEPKRPYTLLDCMKIGKLANILFVVFIIICLIYYHSVAKFGLSILFEVTAYTVEAAAFVLFSLSVIWMDRLVRARTVMKVLMLVYIAVEVILMLLEFQLFPWTHYNGQSVPLITVHVIFSAGCCFSLLLLDPQNKHLQRIVTVTTVLILAGMFLGLAKYRVYASILLNAFAYIIFFSWAEHQLRLEELDVDCYGDKAKVTSFDSTMFADTPTMIETVKREKPKTLKEHAKRVAEKLTPNEEQIVLTDDTEKFEYEFGTLDDDTDEDAALSADAADSENDGSGDDEA